MKNTQKQRAFTAKLTGAIGCAILYAVATLATPTTDRLWATRVKCELDVAGEQSLKTLEWQQGTTPLLSLDQYRAGRAVDADTNVTAIVRFGPSNTNLYFVSTTNYATVGNGYLVQLPTIGTNTTIAAGDTNWWWTAYFEINSLRYWVGNGSVKIIATTSTADGLNWQTVTAGSGATQAALDIETAARIAGDVVASTNLQAAITAEAVSRAAGDAAGTNYTDAATNSLAATAALAATAWQNPASATNWTWTSDGTQITLTGYTGPNDVVIPDKLDNLPVTGFGTVFSPLENGSGIVSITGGNNINEVAYKAFYNCSLITNVSMNSLTSIGNYAFYGCNALLSVSLRSVLSIGSFSFFTCASLVSVDITSVNSIGDSSFYGCYSLNSVLFYKSAPYVGVNVYAEADAVTNYVTNPTATGWGATFGGRPVVRMPVYADTVNAGGTNVVTRINTASAADRAYADGLVAGMPTYGVTNGLLYVNYGSVTGVVYRLGPTNIYLWQVQP